MELAKVGVKRFGDICGNNFKYLPVSADIDYRK